MKGFKPKNINSLKIILENRAWFYGGIILLINIVLVNFPLLNIIGYEFSALNSIILYFAGSFLALSKKNAALQDFIETKSIWVLPFIPLIPGIISNIFFSVCPISNSSLFYLVLALPAYIIGVSTGLISKGVSHRYRFPIFSLITFFILLSPATEIYFNPQVYFYNPIIGYYPGVIYDELISVDSGLIFYRLTNLIGFIPAAYFITKNYYKIPKHLVLILFVLLTFLFSFLKPELGFSTDIKRITNVLGSTSETDHFVIYHSDSLGQKEIERLKFEHEFYFEELKNTMGYSPLYKILSFVFEESISKKEMVGAGNAEVTKPWLGQIYIERESIPSSLKHELVHIFSAVISEGFLKLPDGFNPAMIEGYAVAFEDDFRGEPVHKMAALACNNGIKVDIPNLFSGMNFFGSYSGLSYLYAGSFLKYIMEEYGVNTINNLYRDTDFEFYTDKTLEQLGKEYFDFLKGVKYSYSPNMAKLHFGYKPLVKKVCPRYLAEKLYNAERLVNQKNYEAALQKYSALMEYSDSYSVLRGYTNLLIELKEYQVADSLLRKYIPEYLGSGYYYNLELMKIRNSIRFGDFQTGKALVDSIYIQAPSADYISTAKKYEVIIGNYDYFEKNWEWNDSLKADKLFNFTTNNIYFGFVFDYLHLVADQSTEAKLDFINNALDKCDVKEQGIHLLQIANYFYYNYEYVICKEYLLKFYQVNEDQNLRWKADKLLKLVNGYIYDMEK